MTRDQLQFECVNFYLPCVRPTLVQTTSNRSATEGCTGLFCNQFDHVPMSAHARNSNRAETVVMCRSREEDVVASKSTLEENLPLSVVK